MRLLMTNLTSAGKKVLGSLGSKTKITKYVMNKCSEVPTPLRPLISTILNPLIVADIVKILHSWHRGDMMQAIACKQIIHLLGTSIFSAYGSYHGAMLGFAIGGGIGGPGGAIAGSVIGSYLGDIAVKSLFEMIFEYICKLLSKIFASF